MISKLIKSRDTRESYIRSKLSVLLPAQIRSLRLRREKTQAELGSDADMKQGRISVLERIGEVSFHIETLIKLASAFRVGLIVKFVPMSEMLEWENRFQPDAFDVVKIEDDLAFVNADIAGNREQASPGMILAMAGSAASTLNQMALGDSAAAKESQASCTVPTFIKMVPGSTYPTVGTHYDHASNRVITDFWPSIIGPRNEKSNGVAA
jgi:transcriptional regulator with XRE-family HTH domain